MRGLDGDSAAARLRRWALEALRRHEDEGTLPTSLRHLFYEAVMASVVAKGDPNSGSRGRRPDQNLTEAVTWLREQRLVTWGAIEDRTRHLSDHRADGDTIHDAIAGLLHSLTVDPWDDVQPVIVIESESGAGALTSTASHYRVPVVPTRGQSNGWLRTTVAQALDDRPVAVCYVGDADKAGADIEGNTGRVLDEVLDIKDWTRVALTWAQVEEHGLPTVQRTDGRDRLTREVCELEALPQRLLMEAVADYLDQWLPEPLDHVHEREVEQRAETAERLGIDLDGWENAE